MDSMKSTFVIVLLATAIGCATGRSTQPSGQDPSDPKAPDAPIVAPANTLADDPPRAALADPALADQGPPDAGGSGHEHHHGATDGGMP